MKRTPALLTALIFGMAVHAQTQPASGQVGRTVLDGVYTDAQAARGQAAYDANCGSCHKPTLDGGAEALSLKGDRFMQAWRDDSLQALFNHMQTRMPRRPGGEPGSLPANTYIDVITYILKVNTFPAGASELTQDALGSTLLVGKDGPQPLPTNALVQVVGCFTPGTGNTWMLTNASEPSRTRNAEEITPVELKASADKPLGSQKFRLLNLDDFRPGFSPDAFRGHKAMAKGALVRQTNGDRIFVLSLETVASSCAP